MLPMFRSDNTYYESKDFMLEEGDETTNKGSFQIPKARIQGLACEMWRSKKENEENDVVKTWYEAEEIFKEFLLCSYRLIDV